MFEYKDYIYEIYKEKSFTSASKKLFVSQPALSATVKKVEKQLGADIFDRSITPLRLTEVGQAYIESIEQIYAIEDNLKNKIGDISNLNGGSISVGCANFISTCLMPSIIKNFTFTYDKITLNLVESSSKDLKNKVIDGLIDILIDYDFDKSLFTTYTLKEEVIYLATSKDSEFYQKYKKYALTSNQIKNNEQVAVKSINIHLLKDEEFLMLKKGNDMYVHANHIFKENDIHPPVKLQLDQLRTCYELACQGLGITFVTDTLIENTQNTNGVFFKINSRYAKRKIEIAHKKSIYVSNSMSKFIDCAIKSCNNNA